MRKWIIVLIVLLLNSQVAFGNTNSIASMNRTAKINGVNKPFQQITVNLNDKNIKIDTAIGMDSIARPENFASLVKRKDAFAAINANYFDAYKTMEPIGAIMSNGKFVHLEGDAPSLVVTKEGKVSISQHRIRVEVSTENYSFELHQVNLKPDTKSELIITPERGESIVLPKGVTIEVINNKITKISNNIEKSLVPKNGYLIFLGSETDLNKNSKNIFKVGNELKLRNSIATSAMVQQRNAESVQTKLYGITNHKDDKSTLIENGRKFNIWQINNDPADPTAVYLLSREKGDGIKAEGGHAVYIVNGLVSKVDYNVKDINTSKSDYVIYIGSKAATEGYVKHRFALDRKVAFYNEKTNKIDTENIIKEAVEKNKSAIGNGNIDFSDPIAVISAGPNLVLNNEIVFDPNNTDFKEDKIRTNKAVRSAVGITKDNRLLLITGSNLTMLELAELMKSIGAVNAINLDGGASSALYCNGKIIRNAGRDLHTILTVKYVPEKTN